MRLAPLGMKTTGGFFSFKAGEKIQYSITESTAFSTHVWHTSTYTLLQNMYVIYIKQHKGWFISYTINLLSHTISPELSKVNKLLQMERPDTKKRVRAFIGGTSYFSHMVDKFQQIMSPLHNLAAPKTKFLWTDSCQLAFDTIKKTLAKLPFLYLYNPSKTLHFFCDGAMGSFIAYCLYQFSDDTKNYLPIKYNSHKLSVTESTLSQFETESLALIFAITRS